MLMLKAPLELKCNPAMISSWESFYHRITGNYGLLSAGIDREELLHAMTAPPELYLEEGGMTSVVQNTRIQNSQETRLEVLNNFLNRIAVMEEVHLTYQDRVYITDVLQKLGIREVNRFMEQVFRLKEETRSTEHLISLYWNHLEELTKQVESYQSQEREKETVRLQHEADIPAFTLHEEIMNRLQTGAIYQILNNFQTSHPWSSQIVTRQELQMTEQKRTAVQILLHQLRREVKGGKLPLVYVHHNAYEQIEPAEGVSVETQINSQITSAVLLDLIDNLYLNRFEKKQNREDTWLSMEHALYQTAENTLYRLKAGSGIWQYSQKERQYWTSLQQQYREQEIHFVRELLTAGKEAEDRFTVLWNQYGENSVSLIEEWNQRAEIRYLRQEELQEQEEAFEALKERREEGDGPETGVPGKKTDTAPKESDREKESSVPEETPEREGKHRQTTVQEQLLVQEAAKALGISAPEKSEKPEPSPAVIQLRPQLTLEEVLETSTSIEAELQWVQEGRERLVRAVEQYLQAADAGAGAAVDRILIREHTENEQLPAVLKQKSASVQTVTPKEAEERSEAAETILLKWQGEDQEPAFSGEEKQGKRAEGQEEKTPESAGKVIYEASVPLEESCFVDASSHVEERTNLFEANEEMHAFTVREESLLPPGDTEESEEILKQQLLQINQQNIANLEIYQELLRLTKQEQRKKAPPGRDMRKDSLKALQDPESLLEEYEKEAKEQSIQEQKQTRQMMELLPEQTRRAYEKLEQYLSASGQGAKGQTGAANHVETLLRDIQTAGLTHKTTEQTETKELSRIQETSETILEKWKETKGSAAGEPETVQREQSETKVSLIHKSVAHQMDQELLEQLMEQTRQTKEKTVVSMQETREQELVKKTVHQQTRQEISRESEDLTELIQRGLQRQIGVLSDQIYTKLEKRLQNEKKRRGY